MPRKLSLAALVLAVLAFLGPGGLGGAAYATLPVPPTNLPPGGISAAGNGDPRLPAEGQMTPALLNQFQAQPPGAKLPYWVILRAQADTRNAIPPSRWADQGWYVYDLLTQEAATTQPPVLSQLQALRAAGQVSALQSFWIVNSFVVTGDERSAAALAANLAVATVREPGTYQLLDGPDALSPAAQAVLSPAPLSAERLGAGLLAPLSTVQHNINEVHAPQA